MNDGGQCSKRSDVWKHDAKQGLRSSFSRSVELLWDVRDMRKASSDRGTLQYDEQMTNLMVL